MRPATRPLRTSFASDIRVGPISTVGMQTHKDFQLICGPWQVLRPPQLRVFRAPKQDDAPSLAKGQNSGVVVSGRRSKPSGVNLPHFFEPICMQLASSFLCRRL